MNREMKDGKSFKENYDSKTGQQSNVVNKDTLQKIKIYTPAENFDNKLSFEQNLAEGKVKLFSEMPVDNFGKTTDLIVKTEPNINSQDSYPQNESSSQKSVTETQNYSSTSFYMTEQSSKQHNCDVCYQSFSRRSDLALHYLVHSEKEKRRAAKARNKYKCEICGKIPTICNCKRVLEESYPEYRNLPSCFSISELPNSSILFIKTESSSGNSSVIKRQLFNCPECEQTFGLESQLKQHLLVHKRKRKANQEKQNIVSYSEESDSKNNCETRELFVCPDCGQSFGLIKQLRSHAVVHKKERAKNPYFTIFPCNLCSETFEDNSSLMFHIATVHPGSKSSA